MEIITEITEIRNKLKQERQQQKTIGFVPTMGFLHQGHLALIRQAVADNDLTVVSIFVNPTQFAPEEDFEEYPRDLERDARLAEKEGVDYIFSPAVEEMYCPAHNSFVEVEELTDKLCGRTRRGHFRGVTTVVTKLFNIIKPHAAYFGQKDYQQLVVIKRMVRDLNFPVKIKSVPIVREEDGLALSSRNKYLSEEGRKTAAVLYKALQKARKMICDGERDSNKVIKKVRKLIGNRELTEIEYINIVDPETLQDIEQIDSDVVIALAVYVKETRLIDNIIVREEEWRHV